MRTVALIRRIDKDTYKCKHKSSPNDFTYYKLYIYNETKDII